MIGRPYGSAQLAGAAPGLQIRCGALTPSRVGSIPMHFRHSTFCRSRYVRSSHLETYRIGAATPLGIGLYS